MDINNLLQNLLQVLQHSNNTSNTNQHLANYLISGIMNDFNAKIDTLNKKIDELETKFKHSEEIKPE